MENKKSLVKLGGRISSSSGDSNGYFQNLAVSKSYLYEDYVPEFVKDFTGISNYHNRERILCLKYYEIQSSEFIFVGYSGGFQIFDVADDETLRELVSNRTFSNVTFMVLLDTKRLAITTTPENNQRKSPTMIKIISITDNSVLHTINFENTVADVKSNCKYLVISSESNVCGYDVNTYEKKFAYTCHTPAFALSSKWIAFAGDSEITGPPADRKCPPPPDTTDWTKSVGSMARDVAAGFVSLSKRHLDASSEGETAPSSPITTPRSSCGIGSIVVRDIETGSLVAHFQSHEYAIAYLCFDPTGIYVLSASETGQTVHMHRINPRVKGDNKSPSHYLTYILERGITHAKIRNIAFSKDLRWTAVTSARGTTHVFPISICGGPVNVASHPTHEVFTKPGIAGSLRDQISNIVTPLTGTSNYVISSSWGSSWGGSNSENDKQNIRVIISNPASRNLTFQKETINVPAYGRIHQSLPPSNDDSAETTSSVLSYFRGYKLRCISSGGVLQEVELYPTASQSDNKELILEVSPTKYWDICRQLNDEDIRTVTSLLDSIEVVKESDEQHKNHMDWLSQVEIQTHEKPLAQIWATPQFKFGRYTSMDENRLASGVEYFEVRGAGPMPMFPESKENHVTDGERIDTLKNAIKTPAKFDDLYIPENSEIDQHVLVFDDDFHVDSTEEPEVSNITKTEPVRPIHKKTNSKKNRNKQE